MRANGLMDKGDQPVTKRKCVMGENVKRNTLKTFGFINNSRPVDRVLLKNGRKSFK